MEIQGRVELYSSGRELTEEEQKLLKKDAIGKTVTGLIVVLVLAAILCVASFIVPKIAEEVSNSSVRLRSKTIRNIITILIVGLAGLAIYMVNTLKTAFVALPEIKKAKVIEVEVICVKEKENSAYKYYGDVKVLMNGVEKTLEVPIVTTGVKYVRWQKKGKLYFVPEKYYMLDRIDS